MFRFECFRRAAPQAAKERPDVDGRRRKRAVQRRTRHLRPPQTLPAGGRRVPGGAPQPQGQVRFQTQGMGDHGRG